MKISKMKSWTIGAILPLAAVAGLSACGTQSSSNASPAATASSSAGASGCEINAEPICEKLAKQAVDSAGLIEDPREREEGSASRTEWENSSMQTPGGTTVAINCGINTEHNAVVTAQALKGEPLTAADVIYLRAQGLCKN
ncbi:MAG TPA: hypothetical protein VIX59_10030 [Candidatus Binataceae bacterium]